MLKAIQRFNTPKVKKVFAICMCMLLGCSMFLVSASAADVSEPTPAEAAGQIYETVHATLNFNTILSVLAVALGAALSIFLGWWAIRKVTRMVTEAFEKGKIKS